MSGPSNREILTSGNVAYARKRKLKSKQQPVEEVTFDREKRKEYLTGFHKRKVARKEQAVERAKERDRLEKQEEKRAMKQERLRAAEKDLERYNKQIAELVEGEEENENENGNGKNDEEDDSDFSDWEGLDEDSSTPKGVLKRRDRYEDDDGNTTTVTIESMDLENGDQDNAVDLSMSEKVLKSSLARAELSAKALAMQNSKRSIRKQQVEKKKKQVRVKGAAKNKKKSGAKRQ